VKATTVHMDLIARLEELRQLCPQFRLGQMLSAVESIGEAMSGRSLYHIEDAQFVAAVEKFATDLAEVQDSSNAAASSSQGTT